MSSTYVHYSTSSSLPQDYGVLTRFASARAFREPGSSFEDRSDLDSDTYDEDEELDRHPDPRVRRSQSVSFIRPPNPTMAPVNAIIREEGRSGSRAALPSENTPLLGPLVPRIEEEVDSDCSSEHDDAHWNKPSHMYWEEGKILLKYTMPVLGTHLLEFSLIVASVISIGHLSTTALAASTLGSMTAGVTGYSIIQGFVSALDTLLPGAWTSSEPRLVGLWSQRMMVVLSCLLIPIIFIWCNAEAILLVLRQEPEVARLAAVYLRWAVLGLPAFAFNQVSRRYFQSQGLFAVPTRVIFIVAPINAVLNYLLVWGPEPCRLGFIGAPIATGVSFNLISIMSLAYGVFYVPRTAWHPISRRSFTSLGLLVQLGLAGTGQVASEWWSWELVGLAASQLGPVALATQSVLLTSASTMYQVPYALSVAISVRIGNLLGEKKAHRAKIAAEVSLVIALLLAGVNSTIFIVFRNSWAYLFNNDPQVVKLVASILPLVALFQVFDGLAGCTGGILRAKGKQFVGALLNLSAYYIFGIPLGIWLAFERDYNLAGLWIGLTASLVYCAVIGVYICLKTDWDHEVRKVLNRLAADNLKHGIVPDDHREYA